MAPRKSEADPLGQAATQAPQPMQVAMLNERDALSRGTGTELASGAEPVLAEMKPPAWIIRSREPRSTTRSLTTGKAVARHGSMVIVSPSENARMCSWQVVVTSGPCAWPLIIRPHMPQMPSRQSESNATGSSPFSFSCSLSVSSISRKLMSGEMSSTW